MYSLCMLYFYKRDIFKLFYNLIMKIATDLGILAQVIKIGVMYLFAYSNFGLFK